LPLWVATFVASAAVLASALMYRKISKLEEEVKIKNDHFDKLSKDLTEKTQTLQFETGSTVEAKISTIQATLKSLEKMMYVQTGQLRMVNGQS
jgi:uncharacterized protein YbcC (UPF0753/DUF2309 family)